MVARLFGKEVPPVSPIDLHPYIHRSRKELLDIEYAKEVVRISKLPFDERGPTRAELDERYQQALKEIDVDQGD